MSDENKPRDDGTSSYANGYEDGIAAAAKECVESPGWGWEPIDYQEAVLSLLGDQGKKKMREQCKHLKAQKITYTRQGCIACGCEFLRKDLVEPQLRELEEERDRLRDLAREVIHQGNQCEEDPLRRLILLENMARAVLDPKTEGG